MSSTHHTPSWLSPKRLLNILIITQIMVFVASLILSGKDVIFSFHPLRALAPSYDVLTFLGATGRYPILKFDSWWSLVTATWLHGSLLHIVFNMLALRNVAGLVNREFGASRMFVIFSLSGMIGFGVSFLGGVHTTLGASAGLCGLIGALWYFGRSRGGEWGLAVYRQTSGWLISLGLFGMFIPNIDNWGHAGGFLGGIVLGWLLQYSKNRKESLVDHTLAAVMGVATLFFLGRSVIQALILISP